MMTGPGGVAVSYSVKSHVVRVFKSKDSLLEFLTELERIGGEPITFTANGHGPEPGTASDLADWMTGAARGFGSFHVYSGYFSLATTEGNHGSGGEAFYLSGTLMVNEKPFPLHFEFPKLVETFENATRPATKRERKMRPIPYVTYRNREALDAQRGNHKNVILASIISACAALAAAVIAGFISGII